VDSDAYIARMGTAPSALLAALIDKTFVDLKNAGIYTSLVQFTKANIHNETDAKLNWIGNTFPIVTVGSPTWTAKKGWLATTNKYLKSGFIPSVQITAGTIGEDDCGFLIDKFESAGDLASITLNGTWGDVSTKRFQLTNYSTSYKKCAGYLNCSAAGAATKNDDVASANGIYYLERNANNLKAYYNKVESFDCAVANSLATIGAQLYFGALDNEVNGVPDYFSNEYIRTIGLCKYLGPVKQALLYDIIKYFNDNVGGCF